MWSIWRMARCIWRGLISPPPLPRCAARSGPVCCSRSRPLRQSASCWRWPSSAGFINAAIILIFKELAGVIGGPQALTLNTPPVFSRPVELLPGFSYSSFRLFIIGTGLAVAALMYLIVVKTRLGMLVRAGASDREMAITMGIDIARVFTLLFAFGAALCALAGTLLGAILEVQVGMGESILILAFVVVVIGGVGSIRGALVGALLVGMVDTLSRSLLPAALRAIMAPEAAAGVGPSLASILIYVLMAAVLFFKPPGLFPARG